MKHLSKLAWLLITADVLTTSCKDDDNPTPPVNTLVVAGFTPNGGPVGTQVTIFGIGFSTTPANNSVRFGDTEATVSTATATQIITTVPAGLADGSYELTVAVNNGTRVSAGQFTVGGKVITNIEGNITTNTTWTPNSSYLLKGNVVVTDGVTLTIEPGTIIKGDKATNATLIIARGGKINAVGTANAPIVFTSNQPKGARSYGDWGGIIILGKANNNQGANINIEGLPPNNPTFQYGGTTDNDNSGILKYVRIEFCGIPISPGNEINGLTMGSVGSGTEIDYVQVSFCGDDSFEWFGGTVNAKHIIAFRGFDDDFDTDFGYKGKIQFGLGLRDPFVADQSQSNGFESDNENAAGTPTPLTAPVFSNITYVGPERSLRQTRDPVPSSGVENANYGRDLHLRRETSTSVFNSLFIAGNLAGLSLDGTAVQDKFENSNGSTPEADQIQFRGNVFSGTRSASFPARGGVFATESGSGFAAPTTALQEAFDDNDNTTSAIANLNVADLVAFGKITSPTLAFGTVPTPLTSPVFTGKAADAFFEKVTFKGAFGTQNWAAGWTNFDPQNTDY